MTPQERPDNTTDRQGEQGFALYLGIGFIVLISALAGSVGTRLNVTALAEARAGDGRAALDRAETALSEGWQELQSEYNVISNPNYLAGHASAVSADFDKCVKPHDSVSTGYKEFDRSPAGGDKYRRYFIKRDGAVYKLYGCGFEPKTTRVAYAEYDVDTILGLSLARLRRY